MKKKAIKYTIFLLIIPLLVSLIISLSTGEDAFDQPASGNYNGIDIPTYNNNTLEHKVKSSNTFIYLSVSALVIVSCGVWLYIKKKGDF